MRSGPAWSAAPFLVAFVALLAWWQTVAPGSDRDWSPQLARTVSVTRQGDVLTFANVRDFRWTKAGPGHPDIGAGEAIAQERWVTRRIDLAKVDGVDVVFSYWTGPTIAHVIVSFPMAGARHRWPCPSRSGASAARITRRWPGCSRATNWPSSRPTSATSSACAPTSGGRMSGSTGWASAAQRARDLLLGYVREINALHVRPRWYHTITANCTTIAYRLARELWPSLKPDWRILLPGRAPELAWGDRRARHEPILRRGAAGGGDLRAGKEPAGRCGVLSGPRAGIPRPPIE